MKKQYKLQASAGAKQHIIVMSEGIWDHSLTPAQNKENAIIWGTRAQRHKASHAYYNMVDRVNDVSRYIDVTNDFTSVDEFVEHIGFAPDSSYDIDRIDASRGYEKGNLRWVPRSFNRARTYMTPKQDYEAYMIVYQDLVARFAMYSELPYALQRQHAASLVYYKSIGAASRLRIRTISGLG